MNIPLTHAAEGLERRAFTVEDCFAMVEAGIIGWDERFELIGGEIVPMSPKGIRHEVLKQWLNAVFIKKLPDRLHVIPETTFRLSPDTFIEPDFIVYPAGELEKLSPKNCLLAIEIADSSLGYDLGRKSEIYAKFGITELWVINAKTLETHVHREPDTDGFGSIATLSKGEELVPAFLDGFQLNLKEFS